MIYFIKCGGAVKVGYTSNIKKRFQELQSANPEKLFLMATIPGSRGLERIFHEVLAPWKLRGEWFSMRNKYKSPLRKMIVLIDSGSLPQTLADVEALRDYSNKKGIGRGLDKAPMGFRRRTTDLTSV